MDGLLDLVDFRGAAHGLQPVATEDEAQLLGHGGEQQAGGSPRGINLGPVDVLRRRQAAQAQAVDSAEEAVVPNAESIVVDVGALQTLELAGVVIVGGVKSVAVVLESGEGEGEGVAGAPEGLLFGIERERVSFQLREFGV